MIGTGTSPILSYLSAYSYFLCDGPTACKCIFTIFFMTFLIINKAEHHVIYQYNLVNAADHYMGLIQTESVSHVF